MILYITKETIAVNTTREIREKNKAIIKRLGKHRRDLIREKGEKVQNRYSGRQSLHQR